MTPAAPAAQRHAPARKPVLWLVAIAALLVMAFSAYAMARRVSAFHRERPREVYAFQRVNIREFHYAGRPVTLTDEKDASGETYLNVRYGDDHLRLRASIPGDPRLPGLTPHDDWLRVLRFAAATGTGIDELQRRMSAGEVPDRLVLVTRTPGPGADPHSWGEVNRKAWKFDFYELNPAGGFDHQRLAFPTKKRKSFAQAMKADQLKAQQEQALAAGGDEAAQARLAEADTGVLRENTWQFQAALMVMPPARGPSATFTDDGLHAIGWTMAAFSLSTLVCIAAVATAVAPRRAASGPALA